jgi:parallel beta-helix repeat protein
LRRTSGGFSLELVSATRLLLVVAIGVTVASLAPAADASASRDGVACGDTITRDTKLGEDLVDCPGNGIVIGADGVELDLNGHTIDGDGELGCDEFYTCDFGVDNTAGHHGLSVRGGSIREFATAVAAIGGDDNRISRITASHNILGGILVIGGPGARIERNSISANGLTTDQAGLIVFDSSEVRIERNAVFDNGDIGMFLVGLGDSRVERNAVSGNPETGIGLDGNGNEVSRNRVVQNGEGITVGGDENTITRNQVADSRAGVEGGGLGIFVAVGHDNLVERNFVVGASRSGIQVSLLPEELEGAPPAVDTVVRRNHLRGNGDGVLVQTTALGTVLEGNHALDSGDDGVDVDSAATTLIGNHAVHNGDLGIEAVVGVIDGGRNKAHSNGNPLQCTNVACK